MSLKFNNDWELVGETMIGSKRKDGNNNYWQYWISREGVVYRTRTNDPDNVIIVPLYVTGAAKYRGIRETGYYGVGTNLLQDKFVHRMVATAFVHNPDPETFTVVDHIDGDKLNNHYTNLEWVTQSENMRRFHEHRRAKGEKWYGNKPNPNKW